MDKKNGESTETSFTDKNSCEKAYNFKRGEGDPQAEHVIFTSQ